MDPISTSYIRGTTVLMGIPGAKPGGLVSFPVQRLSGSVMRRGSQFENNFLTEMCSGSEAGSYLRPIDFCIT